jgi:hypothetical protein
MKRRAADHAETRIVPRCAGQLAFPLIPCNGLLRRSEMELLAGRIGGRRPPRLGFRAPCLVLLGTAAGSLCPTRRRCYVLAVSLGQGHALCEISTHLGSQFVFDLK